MKLTYTSEGYPYYISDENDIPANVDWTNQTPAVLQNPDASPADIAAFRTARSVKRSNPLPVEDDRSSWLGPANPERPSYLMAPDLQEAQGGSHLPAGLMQEDSGRFYYADNPDVTVPVVPRPGLLPIANTPEGFKFAVPKLLDIVGNVMGNVAAPKVAAKAGEMVLGSGMVKTAPEALKQAEPFYSQLERAVETAKPVSATADQWLGYLKNQPGIKSEELNYVLKDLPEGQITRDKLNEIVKQNKVQLEEKVLGGKNSDLYKRRDSLQTQLRNEKNLDKRTDLVIEIEKINRELDNGLGSNSVTKYHAWQLPGGENYQEMLLKLPTIKTNEKAKTIALEIAKREGYNSLEEVPVRIRHEFLSDAESKVEQTYKSPHFDDNGTNLLAHVRMNDRYLPTDISKRFDELHTKRPLTDAEHSEYMGLLNDKKRVGNKSLHLEELQSDWHQGGRKQGYKGEKEALEPEFNKVEEKLMATDDEKLLGQPKIEDVLKEAVERKIINQQEAQIYKRYTDIENGKPVPDAPFKRNWDELILKRMVHKAASEGYDAVSWTPGEAQALRYPDELKKKVKKIEWIKSETVDGEKQIVIHPSNSTSDYKMSMRIDKNGNVVQGPRQAMGKKLDEVIGKSMSNDILNKNEGNIDAKDFVIGAEGMKGFYDKMLVDKANALGKKYGSKVEQKEISYGGNEHANKYGIQLGEDKRYYIITPDGRNGDSYATKSEAVHRMTTLMQNKKTQPIQYFPITPELRAKAKEGFPLFSSSPVIIPVDHDPFKSDKKNIKLIPVEGNPFE